MVSIWTGSIRVSQTTVENEFGKQFTLDEIIKETTIPVVDFIPGMKVFIKNLSGAYNIVFRNTLDNIESIPND